MERGELKGFVAETADPTAAMSAGEEARRLMPIAKKRKLTPTMGSLTQAIRVYRKSAPAPRNGNSVVSTPTPATEPAPIVIGSREYMQEVIAVRATMSSLREQLQAAEALLERLETSTLARHQKLEKIAGELLHGNS